MGVPGSNPGKGPLNRLALKATIHCLTGCSIGEVLGLVIATSLGLNSLTAIVLAVALAYLFGYIFTLLPLMRTGMSVPKALKLALASDTVSITAMEIVDNAIMLVIPGAMAAGQGVCQEPVARRGESTGWLVEEAGLGEPPDDVTACQSARQPCGPAAGEPDITSGLVQLLGKVCA